MDFNFVITNGTLSGEHALFLLLKAKKRLFTTEVQRGTGEWILKLLPFEVFLTL
jgi:hypothetical protein